MWIEEVAPERAAELLHNYQCALGLFGPEGSEKRIVEAIATTGEKPGNRCGRGGVRVSGIPRAFCPAR
jgi:hypothetical protein